MRMLTYYQEGEGTNRRSNVSSAESIKNGAQRSSPGDSTFDTAGHLKNDNVYKPFKQEKVFNRGKSFLTFFIFSYLFEIYEVNLKESQVNEDEKDDEFDEIEKENMDKNYNSFFMTQVR